MMRQFTRSTEIKKKQVKLCYFLLTNSLKVFLVIIIDTGIKNHDVFFIKGQKNHANKAGYKTFLKFFENI